MAVVEGSTPLPITHLSGDKGPGTADRERPFYNPAMQVNRDLSIMLVEAFAKQRGRQIDVADVLAGAGARSLRLAHEVDADILVHANDGDPNAIATLEKGRSALGIDPERLSVRQGNAHGFLAERRFDVVDIDPFGSPLPLIDSAVRALRHDGLLCLTATDTAALSGTYPRVTRRRYAAHHGLHRMQWRAEVGLRILAAAGIQAAGRFDRAAEPVLSVAKGHWMRVVLRMGDGKAASDRAAKGLGAAWGDGHRMGHIVRDATQVPADAPWAGPLWTGALHDGRLLTAMDAERPLHGDTVRLLELLRAEEEAPPFWASLPDIRRSLGEDLPRKARIFAALRDAGFQATPSHIDVQGIRTDAPWEALASAVRAAKQV